MSVSLLIANSLKGPSTTIVRTLDFYICKRFLIGFGPSTHDLRTWTLETIMYTMAHIRAALPKPVSLCFLRKSTFGHVQYLEDFYHVVKRGGSKGGGVLANLRELWGGLGKIREYWGLLGYPP